MRKGALVAFAVVAAAAVLAAEAPAAEGLVTADTLTTAADTGGPGVAGTAAQCCCGIAGQ